MISCCLSPWAPQTGRRPQQGYRRINFPNNLVTITNWEIWQELHIGNGSQVQGIIEKLGHVSIYLSIFSIYWLCHISEIARHSRLLLVTLATPTAAGAIQSFYAGPILYFLSYWRKAQCVLVIFNVLLKSSIDWYNYLAFITLILSISNDFTKKISLYRFLVIFQLDVYCFWSSETLHIRNVKL